MSEQLRKEMTDVVALVTNDATVAKAFADDDARAIVAAKVDVAKTFKGNVNASNLREADAAVAELSGVLKDGENRRTAMKRPFLDGGRAVDKAARDYTAGVESLRDELRGQCVAEQRRQQREAERIRRENERKAREARERAEKKRLEELAALAELEREAETEADMANIDRMAEDVDASAQASATVELDEAPPAPKLNTYTVQRERLELGDVTKIPDFVNGIQVKTVNEAAVKRLLKAHVPVGDAKLVKYDASATRSR